jgi:hypothetical protein
VWSEVFFELRFAFVQGLQSELPAMQLNRELIDVTCDFRALRFVFLQLAAKFFSVSLCVSIGFLRLRHKSLLATFLAGHIHSCRGLVGDQRGFAMLAVKENVGVGFDFADGMHPKETSRRYASLSHIVALQNSI